MAIAVVAVVVEVVVAVAAAVSVVQWTAASAAAAMTRRSRAKGSDCTARTEGTARDVSNTAESEVGSGYIGIKPQVGQRVKLVVKLVVVVVLVAQDRRYTYITRVGDGCVRRDPAARK